MTGNKTDVLVLLRPKSRGEMGDRHAGNEHRTRTWRSAVWARGCGGAVASGESRRG